MQLHCVDRIGRGSEQKILHVKLTIVPGLTGRRLCGRVFLQERSVFEVQELLRAVYTCAETQRVRRQKVWRDRQIRVSVVRKRRGVLTEQAQLHLLEDALFGLPDEQRDIGDETAFVILRVVNDGLLQLAICKAHVVTTVTCPALPIIRTL